MVFINDVVVVGRIVVVVVVATLVVVGCVVVVGLIDVVLVVGRTEVVVVVGTEVVVVVGRTVLMLPTYADPELSPLSSSRQAPTTTVSPLRQTAIPKRSPAAPSFAVNLLACPQLSNPP